MPASPSVLNYFIGKGTATFQATGATAATDLGNCPEVEFTPSIDKLGHYSSRTGTKTKDRTVVIEKGGVLRVVMDEITPYNLGLALAGTVSQNTAGDDVLELLDLGDITGEFILTGTNDVGQKILATFPNVTFTPSGGFSFISDEWGQIEIEGEVLIDGTGSFGNLVFTDAS